MRNIKRRLTWFAIALIIQQSVFLLVDKVYLASDLNINAEKVEEEENVSDKKSEIDIKTGASGIKMSSDGRYVSYVDNSKLMILDSSTNQEEECKIDSGAQVVFYKWLNDEKNMIIIQKVKENGIYYFEPISFDAKKGEARDLADFDLKKVRIKLDSSKDQIENVVFSTLTHSLYIKVKKANGKCDLYYANVMNQLKKVKSDTILGSIVVPTTSTNAVIEEGKNTTILNTKGTISIPNVNDNVYFGEVSGSKIKNVYYAVLSGSNRKWNEFKLASPVNKEDIIIDYSGKVYVNNKSESKVLELTSNKSLNYKGDLLQSYTNGVVSKEGNKLIKIKLE
jgi:hypothetical protein